MVMARVGRRKLRGLGHPGVEAVAHALDQVLQHANLGGQLLTATIGVLLHALGEAGQALVGAGIDAVTFTGSFYSGREVAKLAAEQMEKTGGGSIVNISSIMGFVGGPSGHPAYSASKGAVRIYTKSAAVRYGPLGIRVNSVHPGYMPPMLNATNANERADKIAATPLRRLGDPIEVAYGVLFLASDEASFVTGTELVIDGGFIAQ